MSDQFVQPPPNAGGPKIDVEELTTGAGVVERQRMRLGGLGAAELLDVRNALPGSSDYGAVVRQAPPNVDTGIQAPNSASLVDATNIANGLAFLLDGVAFVNNTGTGQIVGAANGSSQYLIAPFELADGASEHIACYGRPVTGLKWRAPAGVTVQAWGRK